MKWANTSLYIVCSFVDSVARGSSLDIVGGGGIGRTFFSDAIVVTRCGCGKLRSTESTARRKATRAAVVVYIWVDPYSRLLRVRVTVSADIW